MYKKCRTRGIGFGHVTSAQPYDVLAILFVKQNDENFSNENQDDDLLHIVVNHLVYCLVAYGIEADETQ